MPRVKVIDHSSAIEEIINPVAKYARQLREHALVLDTETTDASGDAEVIELGVVKALNGQIVIDEQFRPTKRIEPFAFKIHGIPDSELLDKPPIADRWSEIYNSLHGATVLAWNSVQDARFLTQTCNRYRLTAPKINWVCAMKLYSQFKGLARGCKLSEACEAMNVKKGTHRAVADALAAARILYRIALTGPEDEVIVFDGVGDVEVDDLAVTAREFLISFGWREKVIKQNNSEFEPDLVIIRWIDPLNGKELELSQAMDAQRGRI